MVFWKIAKWAVSCIALAALGLVVVGGATRLLESRTTFVDFSPQEQPAEPPLGSAEESERLRFAVATMVSAETTFSTYQRLVKRIGRDVGRRGTFVLYRSYADVRRDLEEGKLHVAFVCTGTYVHGHAGGRIELLVQPEFEKGLDYRSLFIVPAASPHEAIEDLRGTIVAFTDPESNTGCLVPSATLLNRGLSPKTFFKKVVFTGSHDRSISAVALGVVDSAAVDSLVWFSTIREDPSLADKVRIIWQSEPYGPPPIVVPRGLDEGLKNALLQAFLNLDKDEEGREILSSIGIKRFVPARHEDYQTVTELYERFQSKGGVVWP
jgi:phosphonate transport system substrate-binding protein